MEYVDIHREEEHGGEEFGLNIRATVKRELTKPERMLILRCAREIKAAILEENIRRDPTAQDQARQEREGLIGAFGDRAIFVQEMPNAYCSDYCCKHLPWFSVTTSRGVLVVGWRKRVIHLEWPENLKPARELFPARSEQGPRVAHCSSYRDLKDVLDVVLA